MFKNYSFDELWKMDLHEVEKPNYRRGGWSGVYLLEEDGVRYYVKRQENHIKRTWTSPVKGELTFKLENDYMKAFRSRGVPALDSVYFEERKVGADRQAILISEDLKGYTPLDKLYDTESDEELEKIMFKVGQTIRKMHDANFVHRALHSKHLFVKKASDDDFIVKFIDLEKARVFSRNKSCIDDELYRPFMHSKKVSPKLINAIFNGYGEGNFVREKMLAHVSSLVDKYHNR